MVPAELLAYPTLLGAIYGAYRVGRAKGRGRDERFEFVRLLVLASLLGTLVAIQVRLAMVGLITSAWGITAGALGIAGTFALVGLQIVEWWEEREEQKRESPAA